MPSFGPFITIIKRIDWVLLIVVTALVGFGLAELYSLAINQDPVDFSRFTRQWIAAGIGFFVAAGAVFTNYRLLANIALALYVAGLVLLLVVLLFGVEIRGTIGWIQVAGITIQPVEIVKIFFIIYLARFFSERSEHMHQLRNIGWAILVGFIPAALVLLQPDIGSAIMLIVIWLGMLVITHIKKWQIGVIVATMAIVSVLSFFFVLNDEQKSRLLVFVDCSTPECALGIGYNVDQSITAIGSGQLTGRGLGLGPQSQLNFLPEQETDFIFAVISEELGFLGAMTIVVLLGVVLLRIVNASLGARDDFAIFLCWGIFVYLFIQSLINIGMNVGLAPVTGLPLPFISAGGTSIIAVLAAVGIVESIILRRNQLG